MVSPFERTPLRAGIAAAAGLAIAATGLTLAPAASAAGASAATYDFSTGNQGWYTWGIPTGLTAESGSLCADVPADPGGNRWDGAFQVDGLAFTDGAPTTISFTASATSAADITLQTGGSWPEVVQKSVHVTSETQSYEFDVTPSGWSTDNGNIGFQIGGNAEPFTLCLDDIRLSTVLDVEVLPNTTFDGTLPAGWTVSGDYTVTSQEGDGQLCFAVPAGTSQYSGLNLNGVPLQQDKVYRLTFTGTADVPSAVRSVVGQGKEPYNAFKASVDAFSSTPKTVTFEFTSPETLPTEGDAQVGQVALQTGAGAAEHGFTFCLSSISLLELAEGPQPYEPDTRSPVRVNQVGYLPHGPKQATLVTDAADGQAWELLDAADAVVATGTATPQGVDPTAGVAVQVIDFGSWTTPGEGYRVRVGDQVSDPFTIGADIYQALPKDALDYFYKVRSGIAVDEAIAGEGYGRAAGHVSSADPTKNPDGTKNRGDLDVPCLTAAQDGSSWAYGTWTCPAGYTRDVVGGWYDAGDHGKYVVNGGIAVSQLLSAYERSQNAPTSNDSLGDDMLAIPAAEQGDGVPDVLNEAKWELDFLLSMQVPLGSGLKYEGQLLDGMAHHKIHDVGWTGLPLDPAADAQARALARPSTAATLNLAAAAAQGARIFAEYQDQFPGYSEKLLNAAEVAFRAAKRVPALYAPGAAGNNGGGAYDDSDVSDELYWATAELYLTTGESQYATALTGNAFNTDQDLWTPGGFSWGSTAALGVLDLATVPNALPDRPAIQASLLQGADAFLAWQQSSPFGTSYPGSTNASGDFGYEWGSTSAVTNSSIVLATAFDLSGATKYRDAVLESMDYLLGRNVLNISYVTGYGTKYAVHQHSRWLESSITGETPKGSLSGGPNSRAGTWDPTIAALYNPETHPCAPQACYVDDRAAWSVNEVAINWNSSLAWLATFVADQEGGDKASAGLLPAMTTQPAGAVVALNGSTTLTAAASGSPAPTVQWESRAAGGASWAPIAGQTSPALTVTATAANDGTAYRAVFTNPSGTATSAAAVVAVKRTVPAITKQPVSASRTVGSTVAFTVSVSGYPAPTVTWQRKAKGSSTWTNIARSPSTTLLVTVTAKHDGVQYRAVARNSQGTVTSKAATLTVTKAKPVITSGPASVTVKAGGTATFTVGVAAYPAATVQWYSQKGNGAWVKVTGATSTTLKVTATTALSGTRYRAAATNALGSATSTWATLTVG